MDSQVCIDTIPSSESVYNMDQPPVANVDAEHEKKDEEKTAKKDEKVVSKTNEQQQSWNTMDVADFVFESANAYMRRTESTIPVERWAKLLERFPALVALTPFSSPSTDEYESTPCYAGTINAPQSPVFRIGTWSEPLCAPFGIDRGHGLEQVNGMWMEKTPTDKPTPFRATLVNISEDSSFQRVCQAIDRFSLDAFLTYRSHNPTPADTEAAVEIATQRVQTEYAVVCAVSAATGVQAPPPPAGPHVPTPADYRASMKTRITDKIKPLIRPGRSGNASNATVIVNVPRADHKEAFRRMATPIYSVASWGRAEDGSPIPASFEVVSVDVLANRFNFVADVAWDRCGLGKQKFSNRLIVKKLFVIPDASTSEVDGYVDGVPIVGAAHSYKPAGKRHNDDYSQAPPAHRAYDGHY